MKITQDEAAQMLSKWKTERPTLSGILQTTLYRVQGFEVKQSTGIQAFFQGYISSISPLSFGITYPNGGKLLLHVKEADFEYKDEREVDPIARQLMSQRFEHCLWIGGGHLHIKGEKAFPTWECMLFEPLNVEQTNS